MRFKVKPFGWLCLFAVILFIGSFSKGYGQKLLSIEESYSLAEKNYPLSKQRELIQRSKAYSIANISKGYLPQASIIGQATYQSEVTQLPIKIPGAEIEPLSKDQYKIYGEINQVVIDGGLIKQKKLLAKAKAKMEAQQLEVALYQLRQRINQLFFGILLVKEQLVQAELLQKDIEAGLKKVAAAIENGVALKSEAAVLQAEKLKVRQRMIKLKASRKAYKNMLSAFIGVPIDEDTHLKKPVYKPVHKGIGRPELQLFAYQRQNLAIKKNLIAAKNNPKIGLFLQAGYGKPGLNFLKNEFVPYYIGGIRFNWPISGYYTAKKEKQLLDISQQAIAVEKETFLFNTSLSLTQQKAEIAKLKALMEADREIIALRADIKKTAAVQLDSGVITASDYLEKVNAEDRARQNLLLHQIQLLMAQYTYQTISGN